MTDVAEPTWLAKARTYIGFHEQTGNRGLSEFIDLAGVGAEGDPWCAIFVNACLAATGYAGSGSAMARSFEQSKNFVRLDKPVLGCIVTFWRGSPNAGTGHVTFYTGEQNGRLLGLGGNQNDQVCIEPFPEDSHVTGYWWPAKATAAAGASTIVPPAPGKVFSGITATVFGGAGDEQPVAYSDVAPGWADRPGVALPFRFAGPRPQVVVTHAGKSVTAPVVDVGPWNTNDAYWQTGARPQAESGTDKRGRKTNSAGIDLTPATAAAIGLQGKGLVDWSFATVTDQTSLQTQPAAGAPAVPALHIPPEQVDALAQAVAPLLEQLAANAAHAVLSRFLPAVGGAIGPAASSGFLETVFAGLAKYLPELASVGGAGVLGAMGLGALGTTTPAGIISLIAAGLPFVLGILNRALPPRPGVPVAVPQATAAPAVPAFQFPIKFPIKLT